MRVRSKDMNLYKDAPTKVSDMKEGEWRLGEDGIYGRVGDQILYQSLTDYFYAWNSKTDWFGGSGWWSITDGNTTWDTDHYVCSGTVDVRMSFTGWIRPNRPEVFRMTHTAGLASFRLKDLVGNVIVSSSSYVSGTEIEIEYHDFSDESHIRYLEWDLLTDSGGSGNITAIEFKDPVFDFFYDPFTSLSDRWFDRPSSGGSISAIGGVMSFNLDAGGDYSFRGIPWNRGEIDVWTELTIPAVDDSELIMNFIGGLNPNYNNVLYLDFIRDTGQYNLTIDPDDPGAGSDYTALNNIGQNNIFIRVRYKPSEGDTKMRFFYSYSDPTVGSWTEVPFVNTSPIFSETFLNNGGNDIGPGHYWYVEFEAYNGDGGNPQTVTLAAFKEWTG
jgi:hypothetical protein